MLIAKKSKEGLNEVNISLIFDAPIPKKFTKTLKRLQESTSKKTLIRNYRGQKKKKKGFPIKTLFLKLEKDVAAAAAEVVLPVAVREGTLELFDAKLLQPLLCFFSLLFSTIILYLS